MCVILIFILDELDPNFREECRSKDEYTMVLTYFLGSSLLFCFTMSFLFSLCIVGSPLLRDVMNDKHAFRQRYGIVIYMIFDITLKTTYKIDRHKDNFLYFQVALTIDSKPNQQLLHCIWILVEFPGNIKVLIRLL